MSAVWLWLVFAQVFGVGVIVGLSIADWQNDRDAALPPEENTP